MRPRAKARDVQALKHCVFIVTSVTGTVTRLQSWVTVKVCGWRYQTEKPTLPRWRFSGLVAYIPGISLAKN